MMRNLLIKTLAPAVMAIGGIPAIASAHSHVAIGFSFGFPGYCYQRACVAPVYVASAPTVVYAPAPAPVVVTPPVVYSPPPVVYTQPTVIYAPAPAPVVVYSSGYCYPHAYYYGHPHWYRR
jgi:hypothetical protein